MADSCVSALARTNTVSSTITKLIKSWKTSNKSYSYNLLNRITKCTQVTYFIYNKSGKRGLRLSINRFAQLNHNYHNVQNINVTKTYIRIKVHPPTVKMVHNNYNTTLCKRSKTNSKTNTKTIGANFRLGRVIFLVAAALMKWYQVVYEYNLTSTVHNT